MATTRRTLAASLLALAVVACQPGTNTHPTPSVSQIGSDLHCKSSDHGYEDSQAGWGFCYPGTWKYTLRSQYNADAQELDLTFDITNVPCASAPPNTKPVCSPGAGLFAFMIVSTYSRAGAADLATWVQTKLPANLTLQQRFAWGNSKEAAMLSDGRRIALTPNQVVILELRSGFGLLDLESEMSTRLGTWKFLY